MKEETIERWLVRLERAARLLETRLDDPPSLQELAGAAACSPFHFHRIWRALIGESVGQTVNRLRVEAAQDQLRAGAGGVTGAAMAMGFGTPQSFARAFRRHTGVAPSRWLSEAGFEPSGPVAIMRRDDTLVVALRTEGRPYVGLNDVFGAVWSWAEAKGLISGLRGLYGVPHDDPVSVTEAQLRYDAALDLGRVQAEPPFHPLVIPGGAYAARLHHGDYERLEPATQALLLDALLEGHEPAHQPITYRFLDDPEETPEASLRTEILLPLEENP